MTRVLLIQGPGMGIVGHSQFELYGTRTVDEILRDVHDRAAPLGIEIVQEQAEDEDTLVRTIGREAARYDAIICNPSALTANGFALRRALAESGLPVAIVHITNVTLGTAWGERDIFLDIARIHIAGAGWVGYGLALLALDALLQGRVPR